MAGACVTLIVVTSTPATAADPLPVAVIWRGATDDCVEPTRTERELTEVRAGAEPTISVTATAAAALLITIQLGATSEGWSANIRWPGEEGTLLSRLLGPFERCDALQRRLVFVLRSALDELVDRAREEEADRRAARRAPIVAIGGSFESPVRPVRARLRLAGSAGVDDSPAFRPALHVGGAFEEMGRPELSLEVEALVYMPQYRTFEVRGTVSRWSGEAGALACFEALAELPICLGLFAGLELVAAPNATDPDMGSDHGLWLSTLGRGRLHAGSYGDWRVDLFLDVGVFLVSNRLTLGLEFDEELQVYGSPRVFGRFGVEVARLFR